MLVAVKTALYPFSHAADDVQLGDSLETKQASLLVYLFKHLKGELGELQIYFRKIPLHQQKFLAVSLTNSPWLPRNLKKYPK